MPRFICQTCCAPFEVGQAALDKDPDWQPKSHWDHPPRQKKEKTAARPLTRAEVLAKYPNGPDRGVFTDGSAAPNRGPGGWGWVWVEHGEIHDEAHGHEPDTTTNNQMELRALIEAFTMLPADAEIEVLSDSWYCVNMITCTAVARERAGGWRPTDANLDLVRKLRTLYVEHPGCELKWIEGHVGNRWNEYADSLATAWKRSVR